MNTSPPALSRTLSLSLFFLAVIATMLFASQFQPDAWYSSLQQPALMPPRITFPIVWTILYALMPFSIWLVYLKAGNTPTFQWPRNFFFLQLAVNGLWTYLFFGLHRPDMALLDIALLWFLIIFMIYSFSRISVRAALLQIPYFLWVSFAGWLNYDIWTLNH